MQLVRRYRSGKIAGPLYAIILALGLILHDSRAKFDSLHPKTKAGPVTPIFCPNCTKIKAAKLISDMCLPSTVSWLAHVDGGC